ncbi:Protein Y87G2A.16 [Aphelenchoides avenae]|nr:Protein Y87G2A.16 [Aphelenchus avenae]KAH7706489.1 Protein Y87G2A.16 [Aphelenchus avenae]
MSEVRRLNSDPLPNESRFGTINKTALCQGDDAKYCPAKFKDLDTRLRVAPRYETWACVIQKNISTLMQAIMCFLADQRAFDATDGSDKTCKAFRSCESFEFNDVWDVEAKYEVTNETMQEWRHIAVVREPVDKFLSAFVDKCIRKPHAAHYCNGCGANMTCFILAEYKRTMEQSRRSGLSRTFEDLHFLTQSW